MLGLKILLNGQVAAVMGHEKAESLQITVYFSRNGNGAAHLMTHGSIDEAPGYRTTRQWVEPRQLDVGESVSIEVIDVASPDPGTVAMEHGRKVAGDRAELFCSWCGKSQHAAKKIVAGPGICVCDECIKLMGEIVSDGAA